MTQSLGTIRISVSVRQERFDLPTAEQYTRALCARLYKHLHVLRNDIPIVTGRARYGLDLACRGTTIDLIFRPPGLHGYAIHRGQVIRRLKQRLRGIIENESRLLNAEIQQGLNSGSGFNLIQFLIQAAQVAIAAYRGAQAAGLTPVGG